MSAHTAAAGAADADRYEVLDKIGCGSFGVIRKVKRKTDGEILCRKEIQYIKMSQKEREQLHAEFSILSSLRHPNIVAYYHREHLKSVQELHLYMEYCGGGDLGQLIKDHKARKQVADESLVWSVLAQLSSALYRCHYGEDPPTVGDNVMAPPKRNTKLRSKTQVTILHRDLKPENVFLGHDGSVKLGDFGLSKLMQSHDFASTYVGTPFYMSPEICAAENYNTHSDIWSLGCIIYELCTGQPPFNAKTHFHLVQKIKEGHFDPLPSTYSPELQTLVKRCLNTNPLKRPDTWDLLQLPVVRLMRKQREVVELGQELRAREDRANEKLKEAERLLKNMQQEKELARAEIDDIVRREWEVKARLEIDRQVELEKHRLQCIFDDELQRRVAESVEAYLRDVSSSSSHDHSQHEFDVGARVPSLSTASTAPSTDGPLTDDSSLMLQDSPVSSAPSISQPPVRRTARTPFARARTQIDSPADVMMVSPSPASIDSLNLSPRRAAALQAGSNLFLQAKAAEVRWQPQTLDTLDSDDEDDDGEMGLPHDADSPSRPYGRHTGSGISSSTTLADLATDHNNHSTDFDEDLPDMHSPTRRPRFAAPSAGMPDPFKPSKQHGRPSMARQMTVPVRAPVPQPALFAAAAAAASGSSSALPSGGKIPRSRSPTSPARRRPLSKAITEGSDMLRAVQTRNLGNPSAAPSLALGGRTLVELQQARAGMNTGATGTAMKKPSFVIGVENEVAFWDPERDEDMPSPFLSRTRKCLVMR